MTYDEITSNVMSWNSQLKPIYRPLAPGSIAMYSYDGDGMGTIIDVIYIVLSSSEGHETSINSVHYMKGQSSLCDEVLYQAI